MRYIVTFDRIGRNHIVEPLILDTRAPFHDKAIISNEIHRYARKFLTSRDTDVSLELVGGKGNGTVHAGAQAAGSFTIETVIGSIGGRPVVVAEDGRR